MNPRFLLPLATILLLCFAAGGCADVDQAARRSDGLLDFLGALAGCSHQDVVPVERISGRAGEIVTAHAEAAGSGRTRVAGSVRNGFGFSGVCDSHVDVKVLGEGRRLVAALATDFFPRPIPADYRGQPRRAFFSARLPFVPAAGSTIQVAFHQKSRRECEFDHPAATTGNL